ncbi:hypothetical protein NliqN6_4153 [Naganishia liquefaciens]|uniref:Uncharacterized protein n=1 Tax=Naganishia liquefaciens TaxID=104408 RepID=A0A8H3TUF5_9TREE|nr:hypothetical protein NliqN6_4153 [Naganishia liquefaciens]
MHRITNGWSDYRSRFIDNNNTAGLLYQTSSVADSVFSTSSPTGTLIASHDSIPPTPRSTKDMHSLDWLPECRVPSANDLSSTPLHWGSSNTGSGMAHNAEYRRKLCYSNDMANRYFQVARDVDSSIEGKALALQRSAEVERVMHRISSPYPLPCDDQEQQSGYDTNTVKVSVSFSSSQQGQILDVQFYILRIGTGWHPQIALSKCECPGGVPKLWTDISNLAQLLSDVARVLKRDGTFIFLDSTFPLQISLGGCHSDETLRSYSPGVYAFQNAIKWSLTQTSKLPCHGGFTSSHPVMDAGEVAGLIARTPGLSGTSIREFRIPVGDHPGNSHARAVGQMALYNCLALAGALKPMVMKQGCYSGEEFEDFRSEFIRDLTGPYRLQAQ